MSADTSPELFDRRERVREAFGNGILCGTVAYALNETVETATRVRVDKAVCTAAGAAYEKRSEPMEGADDPDFEYVLVAAFDAAGFEIEA